MREVVKVAVTVPEKDADKLRLAIGNAGGGAIEDYSHTSLSVKGVGRFKPLDDANPTIGKSGKFEEVAEERIEVTCFKDELSKIMQAIRDNHPYEVPVIDVYPLLAINE